MSDAPHILASVGCSNQQSYEGLLLSRETLAVHLRRGDYLDDRRYGCVGVKEVIEALGEVPPPAITTLVIFSDSPELVESELKALELQYSGRILFAPRSDSPIYDFQSLSRFPRILISNSTFSWWAARLGDDSKEVWAPEPWSVDTSIAKPSLPPNWKTYSSGLGQSEV